MLEDGGGVGVGIIPAYAGLTRGVGWLGRISRDHPRIRGVNKIGLPDDIAAQGSSPHTRG